MQQSEPSSGAFDTVQSKSETPDSPETAGTGGRLAENILRFLHVLRSAGIPVGTSTALEAFEAVQAVGLQRREDFYWALHGVCITHRDQQEIFDQAFEVFWRNPHLLDRMRSLFLPTIFDDSSENDPGKPLNRRVAEAMRFDQDEQEQKETEKQEIELDAALTWSQNDSLQHRDFEQMSQAEIEEAKQRIARMRLPFERLRTRRFKAASAPGRIDLRNSLRQSLRSGSETVRFAWRKRRERIPPLVILCDISGSMSRYSRILLHFMHATTGERERVHSFLFGTHLTNVTRSLKEKDVDIALDDIGHTAQDWDGGTRIGSCLSDFNLHWSRRVLAQGATVLLITDGLDREDNRLLEKEAERLQKSCRRLIWLNPLLRYDGYQPKTGGARALMPHIDDFLPVHNLESLEQLADVLQTGAMSRPSPATIWKKELEG
ncbi:vWA domain-containing protein [Fodinicurvata fenggangensis]|uniref:vWA domain-containing protein n=1 Tax=Fodinicurvata fenggangensis TaxID=1121830 RepID=UPI0009DCAB42|nr:VWA domain-containing protein [Fodinicurvata fenggangensis]